MQLQVKVVLLGEAAVGKSSLVLRFSKGEFTDTKEPTIGGFHKSTLYDKHRHQDKYLILAAFLTQKVRLPEDPSRVIKFEIWDTAGQERFSSLAPMYYRNAQAAIVVYDITKPASFQKAKSWILELRRHASPDIVIALAGNKIDLLNMSDIEVIAHDFASQYAATENLLFYETSAKTGSNVFELFTDIARNIPLANAKFTTSSSSVSSPYSGSGEHGTSPIIDIQRSRLGRDTSDNNNKCCGGN